MDRSTRVTWLSPLQSPLSVMVVVGGGGGGGMLLTVMEAEAEVLPPAPVQLRV
jgi:hypothetical protein